MARARAEWPLVGFTVLLQAALGLVLVAASAPLLLAGSSGVPPVAADAVVADAAAVARWALLAAVPALVAGMLLSLGHLGTPSGAYRAIRHIGTSWLSREIAGSLLFAILTAASLATVLLSRASWPLLWATAAAGVAAVAAMSGVYLRTIKPAWQTFYTPLSFFGTAILLGSAAGAYVRPGLCTFVAALTLAIQLAGSLRYRRGLRSGLPAGRASWQLLTGAYRPLQQIRYLLWACGLLALSGGVWLLGLRSLAFLALGLFIAAEVLGRMLFFAVGVPVAVGQ